MLPLWIPTALALPLLPVTPSCPERLEGALAELVVWVDKSAFSLGVYRDGVLVERAPGAPGCVAVALGAEPEGDKQARGDERTPEGWFRVTHRNPHSRFHRSLGLNYPTARHAEAALAEGRIDRATRDRVVAADAPGRMPARDTALGGDIYLHGGGSWPTWWTDGCVAVTDEVMDWLFEVAGPGTAVWIVP